MKIAFIWMVLACCSLQASATLTAESGCYQQIEKAPGQRASFFHFRSYRDDGLMEYVGALLNYNNSESHIALVFHDEVQSEHAGVMDYERYWLEVINGTITGQYIESGNHGGNPHGKHIRYTNFRNSKVTTFRRASIDSPCVVTPP